MLLYLKFTTDPFKTTAPDTMEPRIAATQFMRLPRYQIQLITAQTKAVIFFNPSPKYFNTAPLLTRPDFGDPLLTTLTWFHC